MTSFCNQKEFVINSFIGSVKELCIGGVQDDISLGNISFSGIMSVNTTINSAYLWDNAMPKVLPTETYAAQADKYLDESPNSALLFIKSVYFQRLVHIKDLQLRHYNGVEAFPHQCRYCDKIFSQMSDHLKHLRTHTGRNHINAVIVTRPSHRLVILKFI
ncbi:unnamed protein product [Meganyctiphanes norvegica]|uniref:C2H2-type domain-containing protein n=1 Tax=Meganyctiphanes norvegica TaxID=48144 RepID=A0AAV2RRY0_MEGNR